MTNLWSKSEAILEKKPDNSIHKGGEHAGQYNGIVINLFI